MVSELTRVVRTNHINDDNPTDLEITEREAAEEHDVNAIQRSWAK